LGLEQASTVTPELLVNPAALVQYAQDVDAKLLRMSADELKAMKGSISWRAV
jgi:hypothetical protein